MIRQDKSAGASAAQALVIVDYFWRTAETCKSGNLRDPAGSGSRLRLN